MDEAQSGGLIDLFTWKTLAITLLALIVLIILNHSQERCLNIQIPASQDIDNYCISLGYEYGWLSSSSCKENQVQCYRNIGELQQAKCIEWAGRG